MKPFLVLALVFGILRLVKPVGALNQMLRARVWRPRLRQVEEREVPSYTLEGLRGAIAELEALGFRPIGWMALEREGVFHDVPQFQAWLFHPEARAYAAATPSPSPEPAAPWLVSFSTFGAGDRVVRTFDGRARSFLAELPGTRAIESYAATVAEQWNEHRAATAGVVPANLDHDAVFARAADRDRARFDSSVRDRELLAGEGPAYVYSWALAVRSTRDALAILERLQAQRARRESAHRVSGRPVPPVPLEVEVTAYQRTVEQMSGPPRASFLAALFFVTVPLFVAAMGSPMRP
jgi:hypothetical protein